MRRVLQLGLWAFRDPVVLIYTIGVCAVLLAALALVPSTSVLHAVLPVGAASWIASTSPAIAVRRRIRDRRYSVEPPPNSRPGEAVELHRQAKRDRQT